MVGFGAGACYPAGILLVNEYFDRYRGLANGLSLVGTTIGSFALPIYLKFLTVSYGYRYALHTIVRRPVFKGGLGGAIVSGGNIKIRFRDGKVLK
jgi:MFS family permease